MTKYFKLHKPSLDGSEVVQEYTVFWQGDAVCDCCGKEGPSYQFIRAGAPAPDWGCYCGAGCFSTASWATLDDNTCPECGTDLKTCGFEVELLQPGPGYGNFIKSVECRECGHVVGA